LNVGAASGFAAAAVALYALMRRWDRFNSVSRSPLSSAPPLDQARR
jgi:hypothetical protein